MDGTQSPTATLQDIQVHVKFKISALWASVMFCYIYADYFGLYVPGKLQGMLNGLGPIGPTTPWTLVVASFVLAIPSLMIFLSVALKPSLNRGLNIACGMIYTVIILYTMWGRAFYIFYGIIEVVLSGLVVWYAWHWPRQKATEAA